jgi:hypothetical protein
VLQALFKMNLTTLTFGQHRAGSEARYFTPESRKQIMYLSESIVSGPVKRARRIGVHGPPGIGKSTLAAHFPRPLFFDLDDGTSDLNVARINITSFEQFEAACRALLADHQGIETLVIDTVDVLDKLVRIRLCKKHKKDGIEEFPFGKGWVFLFEEFERTLLLLDALIQVNINVVVIAHTAVKRVYLPELPDPFDRYELQLYDRNAARLKQWLDALLFVNWNVRVQEGATGRVRGLGGKERAIFTTHSAAFDAKNRVGLPERLPCEFAALAPLFVNAPISPSIEQSTPSIEETTSIDGTRPKEPETKRSAQERLQEELSGLHQDSVLGFFVDRQKIKKGQSILDVPTSYCETALGRINEFRASILKFEQEHDEIPMSVES